MSEAAGTIISDSVQRFYFSDIALRGAIVQLDNSYVEALNGRDYASAVQLLVGEALAATVLMGSNLKHAARISMQARGNGPLSLLMAESSCALSTSGDAAASQRVRALARCKNDHPNAGHLAAEDPSLAELLLDAQLAITLETRKNNATERYQGIVALDCARLAGCLEHYFVRSEQLPTAMVLAAGPQRAGGLMVQKIPDRDSANGLCDVAATDWEEMVVLAHSLREQELLGLAPEQLLHRLFHQHACRLEQRQPVAFACTCSAERTGAALLQLDPREVDDMLEADGEIIMDCEFCSARYRFDRTSIKQLNAGSPATRH